MAKRGFEVKEHPTKCERCGETLIAEKAVWLELSLSDGKYYVPGYIPEGHESQGGFPFGSTCAKKQIQETYEIPDTEN